MQSRNYVYGRVKEQCLIISMAFSDEFRDLQKNAGRTTDRPTDRPSYWDAWTHLKTRHLLSHFLSHAFAVYRWLYCRIVHPKRSCLPDCIPMHSFFNDLQRVIRVNPPDYACTSNTFWYLMFVSPVVSLLRTGSRLFNQGRIHDSISRVRVGRGASQTHYLA